MNNEKIISELYYNPLTGLQSTNKLYSKLKDKGIKYSEIKDFVLKQQTNQIFKHTKPIHHYFPIVSKHKNEIFQCDLVDISHI